MVVGIKEGTYGMEHWVWSINNESWNTEEIKFSKIEIIFYDSIGRKMDII